MKHIISYDIVWHFPICRNVSINSNEIGSWETGWITDLLAADSRCWVGTGSVEVRAKPATSSGDSCMLFLKKITYFTWSYESLPRLQPRQEKPHSHKTTAGFGFIAQAKFEAPRSFATFKGVYNITLKRKKWFSWYQRT